MSGDKAELKVTMKTGEVADFLLRLANGFRAGRIVLEKDGEHLVLNPLAMSRAEVEIEVRLKKDKSRFSLEMSWQQPQQREDAVLNISSIPPS